MAVYFLAIFLWLTFCYRQLQKACVSAGHTEGGAMEIELMPGLPDMQEAAERAEKGLPFFWGGEAQNGGEEVKSADTEKQGQAEAEIKENDKAYEKDTGGSAALTEADKQSAADPAAEPYEASIRVVLTGADGIYQKTAVLQSGGEILEISPDSFYFQDTDIIRVRLRDGGEGKITVKSLDKSCGHPSYEGVLEIRRKEDHLILINEVALESYVKGVLPGEMPSSYPPEALKAQAVCARTYAEMKQEEKVYPQYNAAVDDGTSCQVYGNLETTQQAESAAEETAGEVLRRDNGGFQECYYFSTSCGRYTTSAVWHGGETQRPSLKKSEAESAQMNQEFFDYISREYDSHLEAGEAFYRWNYRMENINAEDIFEKCRERQAAQEQLVWALSAEDKKDIGIEKSSLGEITGMDIAERQDGGAADCLRIFCQKGTLYVWGEYTIRYVLAQGGSVTLRDGSAFSAENLLPSAFFSLQSICNDQKNMIGYIAVGGGFGHGVGMSQNGAKHMALAGNSYGEILATYYPGSYLSREEAK